MKLREEPPDHAIGRSRGGLSTKIHHLCDGNMRPLVMLLGPGQGGDSPMFEHVVDSLSVPRVGSGRPRTTPVRALADLMTGRRAEIETADLGVARYLRDRRRGALVPAEA